MSVRITETSYLRFADLIDVDGFEFWNLPFFPEILPQDDDIFVRIGKKRPGVRELVSIEEEIRIDLLSNRIYQTPNLWWIIAIRNNFQLVPAEINLSQTVICPSPRYVFGEILQRTT